MTQDELKICTDCLKAGGDVTYEEADGIFGLLCCSKTPEEVGLLLEWYRTVLDRLGAGKGKFVNTLPVSYNYAYLLCREIAQVISQCLRLLDPLEKTPSCTLGRGNGKVISKSFGRAFAVKREFQDQEFEEICAGDLVNGCKLWHDVKEHSKMAKREVLLKVWLMPEGAEVEAAFIEYLRCRKGIDVMVFKKEYGLHNKKDDYRGEYSLAVPRVHVSTAENLFRGLFRNCLMECELAYYEAYKTLLSGDKPDEEPKSLVNARWLDSTLRLALVFDGKHLYLSSVPSKGERTGKEGKASFYRLKSTNIFQIMMDLFDSRIKLAAEYLRQREEALNDDSWLEFNR